MPTYEYKLCIYILYSTVFSNVEFAGTTGRPILMQFASIWYGVLWLFIHLIWNKMVIQIFTLNNSGCSIMLYYYSIHTVLYCIIYKYSNTNNLQVGQRVPRYRTIRLSTTPTSLGAGSKCTSGPTPRVSVRRFLSFTHIRPQCCRWQSWRTASQASFQLSPLQPRALYSQPKTNGEQYLDFSGFSTKILKTGLHYRTHARTHFYFYSQVHNNVRHADNIHRHAAPSARLEQDDRPSFSSAASAARAMSHNANARHSRKAAHHEALGTLP